MISKLFLGFFRRVRDMLVLLEHRWGLLRTLLSLTRLQSVRLQRQWQPWQQAHEHSNAVAVTTRPLGRCPSACRLRFKHFASMRWTNQSRQCAAAREIRDPVTPKQQKLKLKYVSIFWFPFCEGAILIQFHMLLQNWYNFSEWLLSELSELWLYRNRQNTWNLHWAPLGISLLYINRKTFGMDTDKQ